MIKGYGRMGNLQDALGMLRAMQREGKGFEATESTFCSLFDANLAVSNLDGCLHVIHEAKAADIAMNQANPGSPTPAALRFLGQDNCDCTC